MYKFFILLMISMALLSCENNSDQLPTNMVQNPNTASGIENNSNTPVIAFDKTEHDFGVVIQGEVVTYSFKFTNNGDADLIIADVGTSCGCTVSEYPVDPIKPGETKKIKAIFDSKNRIGFQNKRITVLTNATPGKHILKVQADIVKPGQ